MKDFIASKKFQMIVWGVLGLMVILVVFQAGVFVGYRRASFSYGLGDNYHRMFGDSRMGLPGFPSDNFVGSHGVAGKIIKIELPHIVVEGTDAVEKSVLINDDTIVRQFRDMKKPEDLKVDDIVVVIGSPDDNSEIVAKLVRVLSGVSTTSSTTPVTNQTQKQ